MKSGVSLYGKGLKRKEIELVWDIGMEVTEGKKLITLHLYKYLSKGFSKVIRKSIFLLIYFWS